MSPAKGIVKPTGSKVCDIAMRMAGQLQYSQQTVHGSKIIGSCVEAAITNLQSALKQATGISLRKPTFSKG